MREALRIAKGSYIPVAAIGIDDKNGLHAASNDETTHAEMKILKHNPVFLFVTLEPCPACAFQILQSSVKYVFFGSFNKYYGAFGGRLQLHTHLSKIRRIEVYGGICEEETQIFLKQFFLELRKENTNNFIL